MDSKTFFFSSEGLPSLTSLTQEHLISNDVSDNQNDEFAIKEFGTDTPNNDLPLGEGCVSACQALPNAPSLDTVYRVFKTTMTANC